MVTKQGADKSWAVFVKDVNSDKISRIAFTEDTQIGLASDPKELTLTGRLSLASCVHVIDTATVARIENHCTLALITPAPGVISGNLQCKLPSKPRDGQVIVIKDAAGTAGTIHIHITAGLSSHMIDGDTEKIISTSYGAISLCWKNGHWYLFSDYDSLPLHGQFSDTTSQNATLANTAYYMKFNTTDFSNGITIENNTGGDPTRIKVAEDGVYELSISPQLYQITAKRTVSIWLVKNREHGGGNVANSCSDIDLGFGGADAALPMIPIMISLDAGDYVEWAWSSNGTGSTLLATAARVAPTRPLNPSIILVVKRISPVA